MNAASAGPPTAVPTVVTAAVWLRHGQAFLAQRRADDPNGPRWEFPGGKVEPGESQPAALARELAEEFGLQVTVGAPLLEVRHTHARGVLLLCAWRVHCPAPTPVPLEHAAVAWVPLARLLDYDLLPADRPIAAWLQAHPELAEQA